MATSGSKTFAVTGWDSLVFSWSVSGQSEVNNTSTVTWTLTLVSTSDGRINSSTQKDWSVTVNGTKYSGTNSVAIGNNAYKVLASGTTVIKHDDDGTKTFSFSFTQEFAITFSGSTIGTITGSGFGTLNSLARASQPSCITWPEHTQDVGEFGTEISIHMNRKSAEHTHTVRYRFGTQSGTIATEVETGTKWVIPLALMDLIPNSIKGSGTIYVDTYNGTTKVGTKSCGFTATVPASVKPTCTVAISDPTGNADTYGNFVKGLSKFAVVVTTKRAYMSGIKTYNTTANGSKYTAASFTTGVLKTSGTLTVTANVTDNRGRSGSASQDLTVLNYTAPNISKLTVGRCDSEGTPNEKGDHVQLTFSGSVTPLNNKNKATYVVRYKKTSETDFTEDTITAIQDTYTVDNGKFVFAADTGSSYDVEVSVTDNHSTATRSTSASTAFTLMHFGADGTSIGFLKVAEREKAIDLGGDIYMNGNAFYGAHGMSDERDTNETPEWYMEHYGRGTVWEFKKLTAIEFTAPSTAFAPVQTIIPWKDSSGGLPRQVAYEGKTRWTRIGTSGTTWGAWQSDALIAYPVGSIYIAYNHTDPGNLFGGTWERITGGFLWASQSGDTIGQTGGEKTVTLTAKQIPSHNHGGTYTNAGSATKTHAWLASGGSAMAYDTVNVGGGEAHNNMPPYIQVSIWRRIK
jgi:hypothetical protein